MMDFEQEFTPDALCRIYRHYLRYLCEQRLRENNPLVLTPELGRDFGLTRVGIKLVRTYIEENNTELTGKMQREYNVLKTLGCIQK